jgi:hypothetical protein
MGVRSLWVIIFRLAATFRNWDGADATFKFAIFTAANLAPLDGVYSAPLDNWKVSFGSGLAST